MKIFIKDQVLTLKEKVFSLLKNQKKTIFVCGGLILLFLLFVSFQKQRLKKLPPPAVSQVEQLSQDLVPKEQPPVENPAPGVSFEKYKLETSLPKVPTQINLYAFKTNYSDQGIKDFAARFGLFDLKSTGEDFVIASNLGDANNRGYLVFNKKTCGFSFQSFGVHKPTFSPSNNPTLVAENFLREKGILDETIIQHATYQRKGLDDVVFVEFHRNWDKVGLPILNIVGLLNLEERIKLTNLQLGMIDENIPNDETIINTSDHFDGKVRPNDFNTITVAVANNGRIFSIESNLRPIEKSQILTSQNTTFLTPQQAFEEIERGKGIFKLTIPSGEGTVDFNKVYPGNLAQAKQATVTDFILAYLEKPLTVSQNFLQPIYIFKGYATPSSGYRINWIQAIPAIKNTQIFIPDVLGEKTIQLGTFTPAPTSATPTLPWSTPTPGLPSSTACDPSKLEVVDLPGIGKVGLLTTLGGPHTFFYIPSGNPALDKSIDEIRRLFFDLVSEQYTIFVSQEIKSDPTLVSIFGGTSPTIQNMYNLFDEINERYEGKLGKFPSEYTWGDLAPISPKAFSTTGSFNLMQKDWVTYVGEKTAKMLVDIIKNNEVGSWAAKANIFPEKTLANFSWIFCKSTAFDVPLPTNCPYITGCSPSLYFYPQKTTKVTVDLDSTLTYADPFFDNNSWQVIAYPDGTLKGSFIERERLYYEYLPQEFKESQEGFVVKRESLEKFLNETLFPKIGLNPKEAEDLLADVKVSLISEKDSPFVKVSFIDQKELNQKLPLEISPQPDKIYRIHLIFTPLDESIQLKKPQISPVDRAGFVVVETGVVVSQGSCSI